MVDHQTTNLINVSAHMDGEKMENFRVETTHRKHMRNSAKFESNSNQMHKNY